MVSQNSSFSNKHEILNILIGSLDGNEQSEEPVILRDEGQFSGGGLADLTDVLNVKYICYLKSRLGACSQPQCMSSLSQSSAQFQVQEMRKSAVDIWNKKAECFEK